MVPGKFAKGGLESREEPLQKKNMGDGGGVGSNRLFRKKNIKKGERRTQELDKAQGRADEKRPWVSSKKGHVKKRWELITQCQRKGTE